MVCMLVMEFYLIMSHPDVVKPLRPVKSQEDFAMRRAWKNVFMGNIDALRDWGHAKDYVRMQWLMLQQNMPDDFCISTGMQNSVRQFIQWSALEIGIVIHFEGKGLNEVGIVRSIKGDNAHAKSW